MRYGPAASQFIDIVGSPLGPVAVVIHGGFWRSEYGLDLMVPLCDDLADHGWQAWNVGYRRLGETGGGWPGTFDDIASAVTCVPRTRPVVCIGHSAGGHLALWAATRRRFDAVVALAPVADLHLAHALGLSGGAAAELLGGSPDEVPDRYAAASPARLVPLHVPTLLLMGEDDDVVPPEVGMSFRAAALAGGDQLTSVLLAATDHMAMIDPTSEAWHVATEWLGSRQSASSAIDGEQSTGDPASLFTEQGPDP